MLRIANSLLGVSKEREHQSMPTDEFLAMLTPEPASDEHEAPPF